MLILVSDAFDASLPEKLSCFGEVTDDVTRIAEADVILVRSKTKCTREYIDSAPKCRLIIRGGVGMDNIDRAYCKEKGIIAVNTPKSSAIAVAEMAFAFMLSTASRICYYDSTMKAGEWAKKTKRSELCGKTLTLLGYGNIPRQVAVRAKAFGMTVQAYDPYVKEAEGVTLIASLEEAVRNADYISMHLPYTEETDNASRLMFIATREELYQYLRQDNLNDHVVQVVLRSYTGLFADYVYLDEEQIAKRCGVTPHEVYESLIRLSKYRIINYIPRKKTPMIFYRQPREEQRYLVIPKSAYEERRERSEKRLLKVLEYTESDDTCRSRLLLAYFGEKGAKDCGSCDVCLQKGDSGLSHYEFNRIRDYLMALPETQEGPYFLADLVETMPFKTERSLTAIRFLAEHDDEHFQIKDGYLSIVIDKRLTSE